jgi:hypothetical protein
VPQAPTRSFPKLTLDQQLHAALRVRHGSRLDRFTHQ